MLLDFSVAFSIIDHDTLLNWLLIKDERHCVVVVQLYTKRLISVRTDGEEITSVVPPCSILFSLLFNMKLLCEAIGQFGVGIMYITYISTLSYADEAVNVWTQCLETVWI